MIWNIAGNKLCDQPVLTETHSEKQSLFRGKKVFSEKLKSSNRSDLEQNQHGIMI